MTKNAALSARRSRLTPQRPLPREFYLRETEQVARDLLGTVLECRTPDGVTAGRVVETEAYIGEHDLACHAAAGRTARTAPLYGAPGIAYVYFIYGMYWCVNAVTRREGEPSAVLIRALEPLRGIELMRARRPKAKRDVDLTNGPGKLCQALGIDGGFNEKSLSSGDLRILSGETVPADRIVITPRIGITKCDSWPLRYFIADNAYVSKTPAHFTRSTPGR
jgi:DNA-3-methyladenine glycosylase